MAEAPRGNTPSTAVCEAKANAEVEASLTPLLLLRERKGLQSKLQTRCEKNKTEPPHHTGGKEN